MAICTLTYKVSLKPRMKWLLVLSALMRWNWLTNKCFTMELVTGECVSLESSAKHHISGSTQNFI